MRLADTERLAHPHTLATMSILAFLLVLALLTFLCGALVLAFARAFFYQSVLCELDVTRAVRSRSDHERRPFPPQPVLVGAGDDPPAPTMCRVHAERRRSALLA